MGLLTSDRVAFHHSPDSISLPLLSGTSTTLASLATSATPPTCSLNPFLFNGHLQTFWTAVKEGDTSIWYKRKLFTASDPRFEGAFAVDFVVEPNELEPHPDYPLRTSPLSEAEDEALRSEDRRPMLISLHGLTGGSHEEYLKQIMKRLQVETEGERWEMCVINSRGCGMSKIESGVLFNGRATWDMRQLVTWLRERFPNRPLFAIGYSLGANILINYCAEEGESCHLSAIVVCSNPWDLQATNLALQRTWLGSEIYSKALGGNLKKLFNLHSEVLSKNPQIDSVAVNKIKYIHEFDANVQTRTFGYPTVGAYYRDASSIDSLLGVRVPCFCINAEDDPISAREALPWDEVRANPWTVMCTTPSGGHLAWFEWSGNRWFAKPAANFLAKMARDVDLRALASRLFKAETNGGAYESKEDSEATSSRPGYNAVRRKMLF